MTKLKEVREMSENKGGRPPMYKTAKEIQEKIDAYFEECNGEILFDSDGNPMVDKYGNVIRVGVRPLTITGLALALGFTSRRALLNYQGKKEFVHTITRAKAKVEQYAEERLFDKDGANGAKFSLANNFDGWKEKKEIEADVNNKITINVELVDDEE
jgi:4-aminobutyrate aminotransferase-like enzyme